MLQFLDISKHQQQMEAATFPIVDKDEDVSVVDKDEDVLVVDKDKDVLVVDKDKDKDEFREKNNDELMEKELVTKKLSNDVE